MILPSENLRVSIVQGNTRWHDAAGNRDYYAGMVRALEGQTDLIVLPETFTSGFTNETLGNAEPLQGATLVWLQSLAAEVNATITGSVVIHAGDRCVNRLIWMRPDGSYETYDKRHLFRMAKEHERYRGGDKRLIVEIKGWRVCPLICYDLRFPVWIRNRHGADVNDRFDYDLVLFVANWPNARRHPWQVLLKARAIENLSYCIGVNRVGTDGNQLSYAGDSAIIDYLGQALVELDDTEQTATASLDAAALVAHRTRFPAWMDADDFSLTSGA